MAQKFNSIVHFEIPVNDLKRGSDFYTKAFGWTIKPMKNPADGMDYWSVYAKDSNGNGIDGGMVKRQNPGHAFTNYITVESIDDALAKVKANGGSTCMPKTDIGMGWIAMFQDSEGNTLGLMQPLPAMLAAASKGAKKSAAKKAVKKTAAKKKK